MIEAQPRPTMHVVRVEGQHSPGLTYRLFARTYDDAVRTALADYNRLHRVTDGRSVPIDKPWR